MILSGIPRDSRENAVQICPICKFQASTKNPYRHLQDHLARVHFKERIALELPTKKPYICPEPGCEHKHYPDWQVGVKFILQSVLFEQYSFDKPKAKSQSKVQAPKRERGIWPLGYSLESYGAPTTHPITLRGSEWAYIVQINALMSGRCPKSFQGDSKRENKG